MKSIYIPTRGRHYSATTPFILGSAGLDFKLVVEPGLEHERYRLRFGFQNLLILPSANQGLAYVRDFIKYYSQSMGEDWHWQLDDDIRSFVRRGPDNSQTKIKADEALARIEEVALEYWNVHQAGTNQNSWPPGEQEFMFNKLPVQCVLNRNISPAKYRINHGIVEDMDYTLQILESGACTLMFDHIRTDCPKIGTSPGGLRDQYASQARVKAALDEIVSYHPRLSIDTDEKGWHLNKNRIFSTFKQQPKRNDEA